MKKKICESRFVQRLSSLKICRWLSAHPFFGKFCNYEIIAYVICGVLTTVVNYAVYFILPLGTGGAEVVIKTGIAWIAAVLFAFVVNKIFVFDSLSRDSKTVVRELIPFIAARLLSLGFDALFMYVTVGLLHLNEPLFKIISNIFVMIANYFASKLIFRKKDNQQNEQ